MTSGLLPVPPFSHRDGRRALHVYAATQGQVRATSQRGFISVWCSRALMRGAAWPRQSALAVLVLLALFPISTQGALPASRFYLLPPGGNSVTRRWPL